MLRTLRDHAPALPRLAWPLFLAGLGTTAALTAVLFEPGPGEWTYLFGRRFGGPCGFWQITGLPCPSCGMTRSWVWLMRGHVATAFRYNAAGASLLLGLLGAGVLGWTRLLTRNPTLWRIPFWIWSTAVLAWTLGPYLGLWIARLLDINPLP